MQETRTRICAENLTNAMEDHEVSRKQMVAALAELGFRVSEQAVGKWCRGESVPSPMHQAAIAKVLRTRAHLLFPVTLDLVGAA